VICRAGVLFKGGFPAVLFAGLVMLASCASSGITVFKLIPPEGAQSTASVYDGQVNLSGKYLDAGERIAYLTDAGYESLGLGLRPVPLVTFVLTVRNGSGEKVIIDPGSVRLAVGYGPLLSPYNYAHLYMELPRDSDRQGILEDLRMAVLDKSTTLQPGETMEKLLLFKRPEKVGPEALLIFERLYVGGEEIQAALDFLAVDLEK
jgi:hypothetical protein